jgi:hypothetical protein
MKQHILSGLDFQRSSVGDITLQKILYKKVMSPVKASQNLGLVFEIEMLGDLETCSDCNTWYHSYEMIPDLDGNNICRYCETYIGL